MSLCVIYFLFIHSKIQERIFKIKIYVSSSEKKKEDYYESPVSKANDIYTHVLP